MTAAAARKKRATDPTDTVENHANALWVDHDHLPTALAQEGKKRALAPLTPWSGKRQEPDIPARILEYADLALGLQKQRRAADKKKADKKKRKK